jgi:hypothetical protein
MADGLDPVAHNRAAWDREVDSGNEWTRPVGPDVIAPFSTLDLPEAERRRSYGDGPVEYSHSLTGQVGGQLAAGFVLTHLAEAPHHADLTREYMPGYIATRAVRPA